MSDYSSIDFDDNIIYECENDDLSSCYELVNIEILPNPEIIKIDDYKSFRDIQKKTKKKQTTSRSSRKSAEKRIRTRNPDLWKQNIRKKLCEKGLPYLDQNGILKPGRKIGPSCNCILKCSEKIPNYEREKIHADFWNLTNEEKQHFYVEFIKETPIKRRSSKCKIQNDPKRKKTYHYFFRIADETIQVCKKYFVNTLGISENKFSYYFKNKYGKPNSTPKLSNRGRKGYPLSLIQEIKIQIQSLPKTNPPLTVVQMYNLYKEIAKNPVGLETYRRIYKSWIQENEKNMDMETQTTENIQNENVINIYDDGRSQESIQFSCDSNENSFIENDFKQLIDDEVDCNDEINYIPIDKGEVGPIEIDLISNDADLEFETLIVSDSETKESQTTFFGEKENCLLKNGESNFNDIQKVSRNIKNLETITKTTTKRNCSDKTEQSEGNQRNVDKKNSKRNFKQNPILGPTCLPNCLYKCTTKITNKERRKIHQHFWDLTAEEQQVYYNNFVKKFTFKSNKKMYTKNKKPKRRDTFSYYFQVNNERIQVCKIYFLQTLKISQSSIFNYFLQCHQRDKQLRALTNKLSKTDASTFNICEKPIAFSPSNQKEQQSLSKYSNHNRNNLSKTLLEKIKLHISSFPIEPKLSVQQMYNIYKAITDNPVEFFIYNDIYNEMENKRDALPNVKNEALKNESECFESSEDFESIDTIKFHQAENDTNIPMIVTKSDIDFESYMDDEVDNLSDSNEPQWTNIELSKTQKNKEMEKKISRKSQPERWKQNIRKQLYERGLPYINSKGIVRPGKSMGPTCLSTCIYKCTDKITNEERQKIHEKFWKLSTQDKRNFYGTFILKCDIKRRRIKYEKDSDPRKKKTFRYHLQIGKNIVQVCKKYFHNTLAISSRTTMYYFENYHKETKNHEIDNESKSDETSFAEESNLEHKNSNVNKATKIILQPPCNSNCHHLCTQKISKEKRQQMHYDFLNMSTDEKRSFYRNFVLKYPIERQDAIYKNGKDPKKKNTFLYHLVGNDDHFTQVCKKYFLNTLSISEETIFNYFEKFHDVDLMEPESEEALGEDEIEFDTKITNDIYEIERLPLDSTNKELIKSKTEIKAESVKKNKDKKNNP